MLAAFISTLSVKHYYLLVTVGDRIKFLDATNITMKVK